MRYAITGASGLLGGNLAIELIQRGHEVTAIRRDPKSTRHLEEFPIRWVETELNQVDALTRAFSGCDAVFHCAAAVSVQYKIEPFIVEANITGTQNILEAVRRANVRRLVYCS